MNRKTPLPPLRWLPYAAGVTATSLVALGALALVPPRTSNLRSQPNPAPGYAAALTRFAALRERDGSQVNPLCYSRLMTHGHQTARVFVLFHGVTNCPRQYEEFARILFERGHNVLIPRMPQNGYADIETDALHHLTAEQLRDYGDTSIDIACGLGDDVIVTGLSAGGVVAAWVAQFRPEVSRSVIIAPSLGLGFFPDHTMPVVRNLFLRLPNHQRHRDRNRVEPPHNYTQQSTRGLGQILRFATAVFRAARTAPPAAGDVVLVSNAADTVISNSLTERLGMLWAVQGYPVKTYIFPAGLQLGHDTIDPLQQDQHTAIVYPILQELLEEGTAPPTVVPPDAAQASPPPPTTPGSVGAGDRLSNGRQPAT